MPTSVEGAFFSLPDVKAVVQEVYVPFAQEERAILWPTDHNRLENDAEHSFSLALVSMALGERLGLDPCKLTYYATVHDLPEVFAKDTSIWDEEGLKTKHDREAAAIERFELDFSKTPILAIAIRQYESLQDEEAKFVYALDKLLATIMIVNGDGAFWRQNSITYERHLKKVEEVRPKISKHPAVLVWYDELLKEIEFRKDELFAAEN